MRCRRKTIGTALSSAAAASGPPALGAGAAVMPCVGRFEARVCDSGAAVIQACHAPFRTLLGGAIVVLDVMVPRWRGYLGYAHDRPAADSPAEGGSGDLGTEGRRSIEAADSANGVSPLIVANEANGTLAIYAVHLWRKGSRRPLRRRYPAKTDRRDARAAAARRTGTV
jgi:hypothetical protein